MNKFFALLILLFFASCSSNDIDDGIYSKSTSVSYRVNDLSRGPWKAVQNEGSDLALLNNKTKSFFLFNSACRKYESSNLSTLTTSILAGINDLTYIEKIKTIYQEREAILASAQGTIDGVVRFFRVMTTQKNNCIYDFALISTSKKNLETDTEDFNNFINLIKLN